MKLVYIAGPFTPTAKQRELAKLSAASFSNALGKPVSLENLLWEGDAIHHNIARATDLAIRVAESGHMPVCPHANTADPAFLSIQTPEFWYAGTLELLRRCDAIALTDDWQESNGACREAIEAHELGMLFWDGADDMEQLGLWAHTYARNALKLRGEAP